ncbi:MAG: hypothetical protein ABSH53_15075 [Holophaga sp.]
MLALNRRVPLGAVLQTLVFRPEATARLNIPDRLFWCHSLLGPFFWVRGKCSPPQ